MPTPQEILQRANSALQKAVEDKNRKRLEEDRNFIVSKVGKDLSDAIRPAMQQMSRENADSMRNAISEITKVKMPDVVIPDIKVPEPRVDVNVDLSSIKIPEPKITVNPIIKTPDITFPDEMNVKGWVSLMGVDLNNPLPVQLRDANGRPVNLLENLTSIISGGGGGKADFFTIKGFSQSAFAELTNPDGRLKVEIPTGSSGLTDAELRASSVPVEQVSGSSWSTYITGAGASTFAEIMNPDGRVKVELPTGSSGLTDTELRATSVPVEQVSGSIWSTSVVSISDVFSTTATSSVVNTDNRVKVELPSYTQTVSVSGNITSTGAYLLDGEGNYRGTIPVEGTFWQATQPVSGTIAVSGVTNSVAANIVDSSGIAYSGTNPVPMTGTVVVSSITATTATNIVDSSGVAYSTSNPIPIDDAGGSITVDGTFWQTTQPVSLASVPSHAVTNAGTFAVQSTNQANSGVDIGDVTINNASGAAAVNIQDGGNTITVDGTVNVSDIFGSTAASGVFNADNRLRVSVETGASGLTDTELRASSVPVAQASDSSWSTSASQAGTWNIATVTTVTGVTNSVAASLVDSSGIQYSGSNPVPVSGTVTANAGTNLNTSALALETGGNLAATATSLAILDDWDESDRAKVNLITGVAGVASDQGATDGRTLRVVVAGDSGVTTSATQSGTWNIGTVTTVTGVTNSVAASLVDSSGIQYSGSNPLPISGTVTVSGSPTSVFAVGDVLSDVADDGGGPVKVGGIARTANPTAVAAGDRVSATYDDVGRALTRPVQVRDLTLTAYATLTTGTETTFRAAVAGAYLDLIYVMGANSSDAAVTVDFRAVTGGNVMFTLAIPASGTAGVSLPVPIPQDATGNNWTADMGDITGTTVYLSGLFSQEV